ncbi:MAG: hypothetical protein FWC46_01065 [Actinomycetia bacterium]|nr:hypothetical protein [Actinomycetes bacterium]
MATPKSVVRKLVVVCVSLVLASVTLATPRIVRHVTCALLAVGLALTGCTDTTLVPPVTAQATLDRVNASIGLPLDAYMMDGSQENTVQAAQQIIFARCVLGSDSVPEITISSAADTLRLAPSPARWLYGYWDADFIGANGLGSPWSPYSVGQGLTVSPEQGKACAYSDEYMSLDIIDDSTFTTSMDARRDNVALLMTIGGAAYDETLADPRFKALAQTRSDCVRSKGYALNPDSSYQGVGFQDGWSMEQQLAAALAEARCGDDMSFTQQAADINATYQQVLINQHEAELVAIQQLIPDRVARATRILQDVGVM